MGMSLGSQGGKVTPVMNVTPLVDVVLVLLIIFMVITPLLTKKFWVHTPKQEKKEIEEPPPPDAEPPLVVYVAADGQITVNGAQIGLEELAERLKRMFAARTDKSHMVFFDAADDTPYGTALAVLDQARAGNAMTIATLTKPLENPTGAPAGASAAPGAPPPPT